MHPIVKINYSPPTMNSHSKKCAIPHLSPEAIVDEANAIQFIFSLPNTLDKSSIVQCDMIIYDLEDLGDEAAMEWRGIKKKNARIRQMRQIRKRA